MFYTSSIDSDQILCPDSAVCNLWLHSLIMDVRPGHLAQLEASLTANPEVAGLIPGPAT